MILIEFLSINMWLGLIYNCFKLVDNVLICNNIEYYFSIEVEKNIMFIGRYMLNKIDLKYLCDFLV